MQGDYDARIEDLQPGDRVRVECGCGHIEHLTRAMLATAGVPAHTLIIVLKRRLKCKECRWRGRADLTIEWAEPRHC
jgi:hypothetical protein